MSESRRRKNTEDLFDAISQSHEDMQTIQRWLAFEINWTQTKNISDHFLTPLHYAAYYKKWETAKAIMLKIQETHEPGADDAQDVQFGAAILRLAHGGQTELVRLFLTSELATNVRKSSVVGWTFTNQPCDHATHAAIRRKDSECLELLLDYGYPLDAKCRDGMPFELAQSLKASGCLVEIARHITLHPSYLTDVSGRRLLNMMLENIQLAAPGYQHEKIQDKRGKVFELLLALPPERRLPALRAAKDKRSLLGDYLLNYKQGFLGGLFNSSNSAEEMEKRIDLELAELAPKTTSTTTKLYTELDLEDTEKDVEDGEVELVNRNGVEEESSFDSISLSEEEETNPETPTLQPKR